MEIFLYNHCKHLNIWCFAAECFEQMNNMSRYFSCKVFTQRPQSLFFKFLALQALVEVSPSHISPVAQTSYANKVRRIENTFAAESNKHLCNIIIYIAFTHLI